MSFKVRLLLVIAALLVTLSVVAQEDTTPANSIQIDLHKTDSLYYPIIRVYFSAYNAQTSRVMDSLPKEAYSATLDGNPVMLQDVENISDAGQPVHLMFVFDLTSSVAGNYIEQQIYAAQTIIDRLYDNDWVGGVSFDGLGSTVLQELSYDKNLTYRQVTGLRMGGGQSNKFYDGLYLALETLQKTPADAARQVVVVLTDVENPQGDHTHDEVIQLANQMGLPIHLIGFGNEVSEQVLRDISGATGGFTYLERAQDDGDLDRLADDVARVVLTEMRATFMASEPSNGGAVAALTFMVDTAGLSGEVQQSITKTVQELAISLPNMQDGQIVSGTVVFEPEVRYVAEEASEPKLQSVDYFIDGERFHQSSADPNYRWDTTNKAGGEYDIRIDVADEIGNVASTSIRLRIASPINVVINAPQKVAQGAGLSSFDPGIIRVEVDIQADAGVDQAVMIVNDERFDPVREEPSYVFEWDASNSKLAGELYTLRIEASDNNGAEAFDEVTIYIGLGEKFEWMMLVLIAVPVVLLILLLLRAVRQRRKNAKSRKREGESLFPDLPGGVASPPPVAFDGRPATFSDTAKTYIVDAEMGASNVLIGIQPQAIAGRPYPLAIPMTAIGRSKQGNHIQIDDQTMSRRHSRIFVRSNMYFYVDLNAPNYNPSYINGQIVQDEVQLQNGDRIRIGSSVFEFRQG